MVDTIDSTKKSQNKRLSIPTNIRFQRQIIDKWMLQRPYASHIEQNKLDHHRMTLIDKRSVVEKIYDNAVYPLLNMYTNQTIFALAFKKLLDYYHTYVIIQDKHPLKCTYDVSCVHLTKGFLILGRKLEQKLHVNVRIIVGPNLFEIKFERF